MSDLNDYETAVGIYGEQFNATLSFALYDPRTAESLLDERLNRCTVALERVRALEQWHEGDPFFLKAVRDEAGERMKGIYDALENLGGGDE